MSRALSAEFLVSFWSLGTIAATKLGTWSLKAGAFTKWLFGDSTLVRPDKAHSLTFELLVLITSR